MEPKAASMILILPKVFSRMGPSSFSQLMRILVQLGDSPYADMFSSALSLRAARWVKYDRMKALEVLNDDHDEAPPLQ